MVKTPGKRNGESEKQVLHATHNGKVEKKECERCPLLKRATFMLEAQVEKITWKAFLLSEQNRQKDEYIQYLEGMLQESQKTATDFILANSSHREEGDTICLTESVVYQTEETTYPVGPVKEEVKVEIPNQTLLFTTNIEKGSNEDRNEVVATAGDGVEYSEHNPLRFEGLISQKTRKELCGCFWCLRQGATRHKLCICFWCLSHVQIKMYSRHTKRCKVRLAANDKCLVCDGFKMTYSSFSNQIKCNLCKRLMPKDSWEKHSVKCMRKNFQVPCTC